MNIRPLVETTLHHHFSHRGVDRTTVAFKKIVEWAVFDCEAAIELLPVRDKESVIGIIEFAVKHAEEELKASGDFE